MIYKFDKEKFVFKKIKFSKTFLIAIGLCLAIISTLFYIGDILHKKQLLNSYKNMEHQLVVQETDPFTKDKLVVMLKELNIKFPHIAMAQSMIETGQWKSKIFKQNNNLFGMKEAKFRITTAGGTQDNHAYYIHWRESVYDYAFYQCRYLSNIDTEAKYFEYLQASYAEDPNYVNSIKAIIEREKLKSLFM